jgi:large subunit ribosomal protein L19
VTGQAFISRHTLFFTQQEDLFLEVKMTDKEIIEGIENSQKKQEAPEFNVGDTVRVSAKIKEGNRERIQVFEGIVLKIQGGGDRTTFTVRKLSNGIGVEKTWPLHSPNVDKVEVVRKGKVRRAKLYYLRDRVGRKASKVKEQVQ